MTNDLNETTRIVNLPMAHIVYGPPPAKPATKRNWFWAAAVLGASLWGFSGCGDNAVPEMGDAGCVYQETLTQYPLGRYDASVVVVCPPGH